MPQVLVLPLLFQLGQFLVKSLRMFDMLNRGAVLQSDKILVFQVILWFTEFRKQ